MEKYRAIKVWYTEALKNQEIHACTTMDLSGIDPENLFLGGASKKFIKRYFEYLDSIPSVSNPAKKIIDIIDRITDFRAQHTVASFLLGIIVKEALALDVRSWIRISDSYSSDPTFGFFWSLICLTHDTAYYWERSSKKFIQDNKTADAFCSSQNIHFNLLSVSKKAELIRNYYLYCIENREKIDHGVTGAILIYDALMSFYEESQKNNTSVICGIHLRKNFPDFCLTIAETIALHNMWRADEKTQATFEQYSLDDLIPNEDMHHLIDHKNDPLLFLLGLIDTIDPIKAFCNTEGSRSKLPVKTILDEYQLDFINRSKAKKINIIFDNPLFEKQYVKTVVGLEQWLTVTVDTTRISASIELKPGVQSVVNAKSLQAV